MTATRVQHLIPALIVLALAAVVTWLSFTQEPAEAFLFPRLIAIAFLFLSIWNFSRAALGMAKVGSGVSKEVLINISPGLLVMLIYGFFAAKYFGFYIASTIALLLIYTIYDPAPLSSLRDWGKRIIVTALFMGVIYGLFSLLLKVQTPKGLFF